jgi:hypothetical protein
MVRFIIFTPERVQPFKVYCSRSFELKLAFPHYKDAHGGVQHDDVVIFVFLADGLFNYS